MVPPEYEFDVFISYSSQDQAWVRGELLKPIQQTGLEAHDERGKLPPSLETR